MKRLVRPRAAITAVLAALSLATPASGGEQTPQQAYEQLSSVRCFAFGGVGYAGTISEGERAFRAVLASPNAARLFRAALTNGTSEAQLYALCGLRRLERETFDRHAARILAANPSVRTMSGCMQTDERASNVVARIGSGQYDLWLGRPNRPR